MAALHNLCMGRCQWLIYQSIDVSKTRRSRGFVQVNHTTQWHFRCLASSSTPTAEGERRAVNNYPPPIWTTHDFVSSLSNKDYKQDEIFKEKASELEREVKIMIGEIEAANTPLKLVEFIDDIERLGLGYRFEKDITSALDTLLSPQGLSEELHNELHFTALRFRLLRQHGYHVSQEVFNRFKEGNGSFKASLQRDVKGLLSLAEASYLAFEGETLLEEAKSFATACLEVVKQNTASELLIKVITYTLELPSYRRTLRFAARIYIDAYAMKQDSVGLLLQLAKLDFNIVQSALQQDLIQVLRWWKDIGLTSKFGIVIKDRLMECFFWTIGVAFEPQLSNCRIALAKVAAFLTTIDDIYDVYGSLDELQLFTDSVKRWDVDAVENLPDYMKLFFLALYNTVNEISYDTLKEHGENTIPLLKKVWAELCEALLQEAKWNKEKFTPKLEDYIENGWRSGGGIVILAHAYPLRSQNITKQALDRLQKDHELVKWSSMILRLVNDSGTLTTELERGETANAIACHMHETGVSEGDAREHINKMVDEAWKKLIKARIVSESEFSRAFVETAINLGRLSHSAYQYGDGHGIPDKKIKKRILSLLMEPIPVDV